MGHQPVLQALRGEIVKSCDRRKKQRQLSLASDTTACKQHWALLLSPIMDGHQITFGVLWRFSSNIGVKRKVWRCRAWKWLPGQRNLPWGLAGPAFTPRRKLRRFESPRNTRLVIILHYFDNLIFQESFSSEIVGYLYLWFSHFHRFESS